MGLILVTFIGRISMIAAMPRRIPPMKVTRMSPINARHIVAADIRMMPDRW
jgi:hypothetical protein